MGFDAFVWIDGIEGESADSRHVGWIEILNFDLDVGQRVSRTASSIGGATTERADFSELGFSKLLDKASPKLGLACASGRHIDTIIIELCRAGQEKVRFMVYKLSDCLVSKYSTVSGHGEFPVDDVAFSFGKIQWCYTQQSRASGHPVGNIAAGWSLANNRRA